MFGFTRRFRLNQFRRAITVENTLKMGMYAYEVRRRGIRTEDQESPQPDLLLLVAALNYLFSGGHSPEQERRLKAAGLHLQSCNDMAVELLAMDVTFERAVVRTLYELVSLGLMLEQEPLVQQVLQSRPHLPAFTGQFRSKHPDLFNDVSEAIYRGLVERFVAKYMPDSKIDVAKMF